jgi:hypothetical protein
MEIEYKESLNGSSKYSPLWVSKKEEEKNLPKAVISWSVIPASRFGQGHDEPKIYAERQGYILKRIISNQHHIYQYF